MQPMAKRGTRGGRRKRPSQQKELEGRDGNPGEPRPPQANNPAAPRWFGQIARAEWKRIVPILSAVRILTNADLTAVQVYCECYERWRKARDLVTWSKSTKSTELARYTMIEIRYLKEMRMMMTELGLTPNSRGRLDVGPVRGAAPETPGSSPARERLENRITPFPKSG